MEYKDYYKILGVKKDASVNEIKKKYHILASKYHPDINKEKDSEEKFKEIGEAYNVLKDPEKRKAYDQMGQWQAGQDKPPPGWEFRQSASGTNENNFGANDFSEFFENLFGQKAHRGNRQRQHSQRGEDQHTKITLSLEDAFSGTQCKIQLQEPELDSTTGQVHLKTRSLNVKVPAGVSEGQQIRLVKQGTKGTGGAPSGDLYLEIQLSPHPLYTVKNKDIYLNLPVTPWEAALGATIEVPTLGGKVQLKIPSGSQTGTKLRLKGRGLPGKSAGDQYVLLVIYIQEPKTENQRQLYQKMAEEMNYNPRELLLKGA